MPIRKILARSIGTDVIVAEDIAANAITVSELSNGAVTPAKLSTGGPTWDSGSYFAIGESNSTSSKLHVGETSFPATNTHLASFRAGTDNPYSNRYIKIQQTFTGSAFDSPVVVFETNANGSNDKSYGTINLSSNGNIVFGTKIPGASVALGTALNVTERLRIGNSNSTDGILQVAQQSGTTSSTLGFIGNDNAVIASRYSLVNQIDSTNSYTGRSFDWKTGGKGYSDGSLLMTLNQNARLGINFTNPTHDLTVGGPVRYGAPSSNSRSVLGFAEGFTTSEGANRFMHWKTNLWGGGSPNGQSQPTMSLFTIKGYDYRGYVIDSSMGFHNWSGSIYSLASQDRGTLAVSPAAYVSSDGFVCLRINCSNASYFAVTIDWHQIYGYSFVNARVTAQTTSSSTTAY